MSSLQFHLDQAFVARQLAETSNARAVAIRNQLVLRLRRLYEADHSEAMSAAYGVDHAVTTALEGLFDNPAPLAPAPDTLLIDQLLLHADPTIFDEQSHPQVAAYRIALLPVAPQQHAPPADHPAPPAPSNIGPPPRRPILLTMRGAAVAMGRVLLTLRSPARRRRVTSLPHHLPSMVRPSNSLRTLRVRAPHSLPVYLHFSCTDTRGIPLFTQRTYPVCPFAFGSFS